MRVKGRFTVLSALLLLLLAPLAALSTTNSAVPSQFLIMEKRINGYMRGNVGYVFLDELLAAFPINLERYGDRTFSARYKSRSCRLFDGQNAIIFNGKLLRFEYPPIIVHGKTAVAAKAVESLLGQPVSLLFMEAAPQNAAAPALQSKMNNIFVQQDETGSKLIMSFDNLPAYDVRGGDPATILRFVFSNTVGTDVFGKALDNLERPMETVTIEGEGVTTEVTVHLSHPMRWFDEAFGEVGKLEIALFTPEAIAPLEIEPVAQAVATGEAQASGPETGEATVLPVFGQLEFEDEEPDIRERLFEATGELTMLFESILLGATVEEAGESDVPLTTDTVKTDLDISEWLRLLPDKTFTVVLDPGHGGEDYGCRAVHHDLMEKDLNLAYARRIQHLFAGSKIRVILTRDGDFSLSPEQRKDTANRAGADLFISIHTDSVLTERLRGLHVFHYAESKSSPTAVPRNTSSKTSGQLTENLLPEDLGIDQPVRTESLTERSERLAGILFNSLKLKLGWPGLGVRGQRLLVLEGLLMPGVLVEIGFLSSTEDIAALKRDDIRTAVAEGILIATVRYLSGR